MADSYATIDRIQTLAIFISAVTGRVFRFYGLQSLRTKKDDSGAPGTWEITALSVPRDILLGPSDDAADYLKVAGPMDLCALYARRLVTNAETGVRESRTYPIGPASGSTLQYGKDSGATVALLGAPAQAPQQEYSNGDFTQYQALGAGLSRLLPTSRTCCLMVGMVDGVFETVNSAGQLMSFTARGRDLTKILYVNDTMVPQSTQASTVTSSSGGAPPLLTYALSREGSGAQLLIDMMNILVAKTLPPATIAASGLTPATVNDYASFGYPWADFLSLKRMSTDFRSFKQEGTTRYAPFSIQAGSAAANIEELRNPPVNRLFIDEWGQIVFDDQYGAWTAAPSTTIGTDQISWLNAGFDDSALITYLSTFANGSLAARSLQGEMLGLQRNNGFIGGLAQAVNASDAHVQRYGYRYGEFTSNFDITPEAVAQRRKVLIFMHNNLWHGQALVKGNPFYRVGDRYLLDIETNRPETSKQTWYASAVTHEYTFGDNWTTTLDVAYPDLSAFTTSTVP